jgi:hypothetical protein
MPHTFSELVEARKAWIDGVLRPWCRQAKRIELLKAHDEWLDIAGRVDQEFTLWLWAWSRFPALYVDELKGLDESYEVRVTLQDGREVTGFPDARESGRGMLVLFANSETGSHHVGPFSIDEVAGVERLNSPAAGTRS